MFTSRKPHTTAVLFGAAALAVPLGVTTLVAQSLVDHLYPRDVLLCKIGDREAHLYGKHVGWVSKSALALLHKDASGKQVIDGIYAVGLSDLSDTEEGKREAARRVADRFCKTGMRARSL